jgi:hypothetical protein
MFTFVVRVIPVSGMLGMKIHEDNLPSAFRSSQHRIQSNLFKILLRILASITKDELIEEISPL